MNEYFHIFEDSGLILGHFISGITGQLSFGQSGTGHLGSGHLFSGHLGTGHLGSGHLGTGHLGFGHGGHFDILYNKFRK